MSNRKDILASLRERCGAATGGSDELDMQLWWYVERGETFAPIAHIKERWIATGAYDCDGPTSDLSAALALVEARLPGWGWHVYDQKAITEIESKRGWGAVRAPFDEWGRAFGKLYEANAHTPTLAVICALLAALEQTEEKA